jgi:oxygen-independent coproporphyrinogen-3 oxidase
MHWGGGSPNILSAEDIAALAGNLCGAFVVEKDSEFAVEIDPRQMDTEKADAFAEAGVTRASIGVQDFDPQVQAAIGRKQSFKTTSATVSSARHQLDQHRSHVWPAEPD